MRHPPAREFRYCSHAPRRPPLRQCLRSVSATCSTSQSSRALACVFELWHCFEFVLGCAGKNELFIIDLELIDRDSHVVFAKTQEPARADDGVGDSLVGGDYNILDLSNFLVLVVVDRLTQDLPLRAPALRNFPELSRSNAELGRARHLTKRSTRRAQQDGD